MPVAILVILAVVSGTSTAQATERPDALIEAWYEANDACRGTHAGSQEPACARRSTLETQIKTGGWCYSHSLSGWRWSSCAH